MLSSSDDVTTAVGTCSSYDRLRTMKQQRQSLHHHHRQHQQQEQRQRQRREYFEENIVTHEHETDFENFDKARHQHQRQHKKYGCSGTTWCCNQRHKMMVMMMLLVMLLYGHVTVSTAQRTMRFLVEPQNRTVAEGWTAVFNCTIENKRGPVTWSQEGFAMGIDRGMEGFPRYSMLGTEQNGIGEWNLQIQDVKLEEDEGNYECQVNPSENSRGMRSRKAYLTVVVPPERPVIRNGSRIPVVLNRPSRIMCSANNGKPAPSITWHINGERMTQNVTVVSIPNGRRLNTTGIFTLTSHMEHHGKQIECQTYTQFMRSPYRTFATLDVQYPPNLTMSINVTSRSIREYDYVRIQCYGLSNPAPITWRWFNNGNLIPNVTTNTYNIPAIGPEFNNVVISCQGNNSVGATRLDKTLNVEYGPRITQITSVVGADEGQSAELNCEVDGNPAPSIIWRRKDRSRKSHHVLHTKNKYRIDHVTSGSYGWYVCTAAVIGFPDTSKEAMLLKNDRPNPRSEKQQMAVKGERGKIECLVKAIPKPDEVKWSKGGRNIDLALSGRFSVVEEDMLYGVKNVLIIKSVQSGDFGFYNCTVKNGYGTSYDEIELVEKSSDTVPITYIIVGIIGGFAVIFVTALVCVLYHRYKREDQGSVLGSYTDTDSSSDKKRDKADSPSTLMGQFRQGYTKDVYRFSADYDDVPYKEHTKGNNNGYGFIEPYEYTSDHPIYDGEYVHGGEDPIPTDRFDSLYSTGTGPGFNMSSFRGNNYDTTPPPTMTRITPLHMNSSKLATDV